MRQSTDHLERVKHSHCKSHDSLPIDSYKNNVTELDKTCIGEWCIFRKEGSDSCLLGFVLGFAYPAGKTWKSIEFSGN